jgi:lysophospholipase L1-like esterase
VTSTPTTSPTRDVELESPRVGPRSRVQHLRAKIALAAVATLLALVAAEVMARLAVPAPLAWRNPQTLYRPDPLLHYRMRPNQTGYTADKPFGTNRLGLRGADIAIEKPPGVRRILLLGDSIAFGFGVADEDTFAALLERDLNGRAGAGVRYDVINAGQPAFNTHQEVTYFATEGQQLSPDAVIIALYWNDIHSEMLQHADADGRLIEGSPDAELSRSERIWSSAPVMAVRNFVKRSRLIYLVLDRLRTLSASSATDEVSNTYMSVLLGRPDQRVEDGWRQVEDNLSRLATLCRERSVPLVLAIMPMAERLSDRFPTSQYPARVEEICHRLGIPYVDLHGPFRQAIANGPLFINYDLAHPNEKGHAIIASELDRVMSGLLAPAGSGDQ